MEAKLKSVVVAKKRRNEGGKKKEKKRKWEEKRVVDSLGAFWGGQHMDFSKK